MEVVGKDTRSGQTGLLEAVRSRGRQYGALAQMGGLSMNFRNVANRHAFADTGLRKTEWTTSHQLR